MKCHKEHKDNEYCLVCKTHPKLNPGTPSHLEALRENYNNKNFYD